MTLLNLIQAIYEVNKANGFWEEGRDRCVLKATNLLHSEISECVEVLRKDENAMDDKLPQYLAWHVELADAFIRFLDILGGYFDEADLIKILKFDDVESAAMLSIEELTEELREYVVETISQKPNYHNIHLDLSLLHKFIALFSEQLISVFYFKNDPNQGQEDLLAMIFGNHESNGPHKWFDEARRLLKAFTQCSIEWDIPLEEIVQAKLEVNRQRAYKHGKQF
jgi:hypothetical protein